MHVRFVVTLVEADALCLGGIYMTRLVIKSGHQKDMCYDVKLDHVHVMCDVSIMLLIAHPHLLMRATNERFLLAGATFRAGLASENH